MAMVICTICTISRQHVQVECVTAAPRMLKGLLVPVQLAEDALMQALRRHSGLRLLCVKSHTIQQTMTLLSAVLPAQTLERCISQHPNLVVNHTRLLQKLTALQWIRACPQEQQRRFAASFSQPSMAARILTGSVRCAHAFARAQRVNTPMHTCTRGLHWHPVAGAWHQPWHPQMLRSTV